MKSKDNHSHTKLIKDADTLNEILKYRAKFNSNNIAYHYIINENDSEISISYKELYDRSLVISQNLAKVCKKGDRALMLYSSNLEFVIAFFGCLYACVIAVPAYPPRQNQKLNRLKSIIEDSNPKAVLTTQNITDFAQSMFKEDDFLKDISWISSDNLTSNKNKAVDLPTVTKDDIAFLQYTSGSTGNPKGVIVSHANIINNEEVLYKVFKHHDDTICASWLPLFHDMGLIFGALHPIYGGFPVILMNPTYFLQKPVRWLQAISKYKANSSGGPNFSYDLCVDNIKDEDLEGIDLSSWKIAYNGAEPVLSETLNRFYNRFSKYGLRKESLYPCYGMAETTLFVIGGKVHTNAKVLHVNKHDLHNDRISLDDDISNNCPLVSCGYTWYNHKVLIVNPDNLETCKENQVGEIWAKGNSIAQGYWQKTQATQETFHAYTSDSNEGPYLRTGDLGFYHKGELYITGRLKDVVIIRGRNHYPQDIELTTSQSHESLVNNSTAAFAIDEKDDIALKEERLVIIQEVARTYINKIDFEEIFEAIKAKVANEHELQVYDIVLLKPNRILKTSSGKIQRRSNKQSYLEGNFEILAQLRKNTPHAQNKNSKIQEESQRKELLVKISKEVESEQKKNCLRNYIQFYLAKLINIDEQSINIKKSLLEIGYDSLSTIQIASHIQEVFNYNISIEKLFEYKSINHLIDDIYRNFYKSNDEKQYQPIEKIDKCGPIALSYHQERLWFLDKYEQKNTYNVPVLLEIDCNIDPKIANTVLKDIIQRHEILRTNFLVENNKNCAPVQIINSKFHFNLETVNLAESATQNNVEKLAKKCHNQSFDLENDLLIRATLYKIDNKVKSYLLINMHHIVCDGWSIEILMKEFVTLYKSYLNNDLDPISKLPPISIQYADYAVWQRKHLSSKVMEEQLGFWKKQLANLEQLQLPTSYPRTSIRSNKGNTISFQLSKATTNKLRKIGRQNDVTLFMTLLTAFNILLQRYSNQDDITIGTVTAGRGKVEIEPLIGFFVNTLALRQDLSNNPSFRELLQKVKRTTLDAYKYQYVPFEKVVDALNLKRDSSRSSLFQVMLELNNISAGTDLPMIAKELSNDTSKFDLTLRFTTKQDNELVANVEYTTDLFSEGYIKRFIGNFKQLINSIIENPKQNISEFNILTQNEKQQLLVTYNDTQAQYQKNKCVHELFEQQAQKTPKNIAVKFKDKNLTYEELNRQSNQLARYLRSEYKLRNNKELTQDTLIGISIDRSLDMIVGIFAILKAGGAYLPLDPSYPQDRLEYMVKDSAVNMILTQKSLTNNLSKKFIKDQNITTLFLDVLGKELNKLENSNLNIKSNASNLAYVIYTSGSTGKPKGVMVEHQGLVNVSKSQGLVFGIKPSDNILQFASLNFDAAIWEIVLTLLCGAKLTLCTQDIMGNPTLLQSFIDQQKITVAILPPVMLGLLEIDKMSNIKTIISGGEACSVTLAKSYASKIKFFNAYGPTENTICASIYKCDINKLDKIVPIGKPTSNVQFYILDKYLNPTPKGVIGELHIAGDNLARGYLNKLQLTQEKFIKNSFSTNPKSRIYKTGDLVRYLEDGNIEYVGRTDDQIKIRGFRIELGEIEQQLQNITEVKDAVVIVKENKNINNKILVAYIVTNQDIDIIKSQLEQKLPHYMVPAVFIKKDSLPTTPNGKVNRKSLQEIDLESITGNKYIAPRNNIEKDLAKIFESILGIKDVGINDDFFELGGNSLLVTRLALVINKQFPSQTINIQTLFLNSTIERLSKYITNGISENKDKLIDIKDELNKRNTFEDTCNQKGNYKNPEAIFLTGANGFVGIHLLHNLLSTTKAEIYCLIRGSSLAECKRKLEISINKYDITISRSQWDRIILIKGDLEQAKLGISEKDYDSLISKIDIIIHGGAFVNHLYLYDQLRKANVESTFELIKMSKMIRKKKLIFISTMSVLKNHGEDQEDVDIESFKFTQTDGYTASKWVSEVLIKNANIDYQIHRISRVGGDTKSNIGPLNDMTYRYWKTCLMLGKYPTEFNHWQEDIRPIDQTVEIIATLAMKHELNSNVFHLNNQKKIGINEPLEVAKKNILLEEVPLKEWLQLLEKGKLGGKDLPFYPYLGLVKIALGNKAIKHANDNIQYGINNKNTMKLLPLKTRTFKFNEEQLMRYINQCNEI